AIPSSIKAVEDLNRALELREPHDRTFSLASRGAAYFRLERFDEALSDLNDALKLDPMDDFARVTRVKVYMAMNRQDEARKELERLYEDGSASRH
ncbi:470_t:CDS:1, partial [Paraglomus occultum]